LIDDANTPPEKPERLAFKTIDINFENGDIGAFRAADPKMKSVKLSIVSGDQAISGKSLLVQMDSAIDGEWIRAFITDPAKIGIVGWRNYRVTFDLKPLKATPGKDSYFFFQASGPKGDYGNITYKFTEAGSVLNAAGEIRDIFKNGTWGLQLGGHFGCDVAIDNIHVEEIQ
jgi:multiple sugar transport system substrate-binding protein